MHQYKQLLPRHIRNPDETIYNSNNWIVLDFETSSIDYGDSTNPENTLVLACWYSSVTERYYHEWCTEYTISRLLEDIYDYDFIVAHNAKFELGWLKRCGIDLRYILPFCTQIAEYSIHQGLNVPVGLDDTLKRRRMASKHSFGAALVHGGVDPREVPRSVLRKYCLQDVRATKELFLMQRQELKELDILKPVYTRNIFTPVLADIEFNGMMLDEEKVKQDYDETIRELRNVEQEFERFSGGINPRSPDQMAEFIFDTLGFAEPKDWKGNPIRTSTDKRSVSQEVIGKLQARNRRQREFLGLKSRQGKLQSRVSKYLSKFKDCCEEAGGILKFQFNQTITQTGRLSSNGKKYKVQGQNIQRDLKGLFRARQGRIYQERDYAQLEFRSAGELTGDEQIMVDVVSRNDIHAYTASIIFPNMEDRKAARQQSKAHTFKPLYGGESGTETEQAYYKAFKEKYKRLTETQNEWINQALKSEKVRTPITGLIFNFPDLKTLRSGYILGSTKVRDYPIQYFATGEVVPIGVSILWHLMQSLELNSCILNTIHDSVVNELVPEEKELVDELAVLSLTTFVKEYINEMYGYELQYPLEIELKEGTHWG